MWQSQFNKFLDPKKNKCQCSTHAYTCTNIANGEMYELTYKICLTQNLKYN